MTTVPSPPSPGFSLARMARLVSKELRESLRDRRTLLTLVLMPFLLYPLLGLVFFIYFRSPLLAMGTKLYRLGFRNTHDGRLMEPYLRRGERALRRDQGFEQDSSTQFPAGRRPSEDELKANQRVPPIKLANLELYVAEDVEQSLRAGHVDLAVELVRIEGLENLTADGNVQADWKLICLEDSAIGLEALHYVQRLVAAANGEFLSERLRGEGIRGQRNPPVHLEPELLSNPRAHQYSLLGALLPLILILMTITGAVYPAIDLTAGERERGTMEILMAAPVPRLSLLLAKYVAVVTVALLTALMNLIFMTGTLIVLGGGPFLFASGFHVILIVIEVLGLLVIFAAFFSAVLLSLTSFTRSFKEAQAYLIPLMLVALTPGLLSLLPGLRLQGINPYIPLLNIVLLARDLLDGTAHALPAIQVVFITFLYAVAALALAAKIFGRSAIAGT
jgi:sodium transport system permease protein